MDLSAGRSESSRAAYAMTVPLKDLRQLGQIRKFSAGPMIAAARVRSGMKQRTVAELVGITISHLSDLERGVLQVSQEMAGRLARVLDLGAAFAAICEDDEMIAEGQRRKRGRHPTSIQAQGIEGLPSSDDAVGRIRRDEDLAEKWRQQRLDEASWNAAHARRMDALRAEQESAGRAGPDERGQLIASARSGDRDAQARCNQLYSNWMR